MSGPEAILFYVFLDNFYSFTLIVLYFDAVVIQWQIYHVHTHFVVIKWQNYRVHTHFIWFYWIVFVSVFIFGVFLKYKVCSKYIFVKWHGWPNDFLPNTTDMCTQPDNHLKWLGSQTPFHGLGISRHLPMGWMFHWSVGYIYSGFPFQLSLLVTI